MINVIEYADSSNNEILKSSDFRNWMEGLLHEDYPITVTFTKKDGTLRKMLCTKSIVKIPVDMQPSGDKTIKEGSAIRVFDLEANGWRSFNPESIKQIEFNIE